MARPAIAIALPPDESAPVAAELREAGFTVDRPSTSRTSSRRCSPSRRDVAVAILDGETDFDQSLEYYGLLREDGRAIPALMVVSPRALEQLASHADGQQRRGRVLHPPLLRRVAALARRGHVHPQPDRRRRLRPGPPGRLDRAPTAGPRRATVIAVFNPKGGVGKTTVATNLASRPPGPQGPERPAHRRRHRHRPRHDVARHRRACGRSPTAGATSSRAVRSRRSPSSPRRIRRA